MQRHLVRSILFLPLLVVLIALVACDSGSGPTLPPSTAGGGFFVETRFQEEAFPPVLVGGVQVNLEWAKDLPGAQGSPATQDVITDVDTALAAVPNGRAPATWNFLWVAGSVSGCSGVNLDANVILDGIELFTCTEINDAPEAGHVITSPFQFEPNPLDTSSLPATVTITGQGFSTQYGLPLVQYFDLSGTLVAQMNAETVSSDGTSIAAPPPALSGVVSGTYVGFISNANASGGWDLVGTVSLTVAAPAPPPPPPPPCKPCEN